MENIVTNLHSDSSDLSLIHLLAERIDEETGILAEPLRNMVSEEIIDYVDDIITKAARAVNATADAMRHGDIKSAKKYQGITEGLCYAASMAAGASFTVAFLNAVALASEIR